MGATPLADNVLTDRLLRSWLRCRRKAWLDRHGDANQRRWTAHRNLLLDDQQRSFVALLPHKARSWPGRPVLLVMRGWWGCVSKGKGPSGEPVEAHPPLLLRVAGQSRWGPVCLPTCVGAPGQADHEGTSNCPLP